uniref:Glutathione-S-transferase epsilon class 5 n=1 Tax=Sitophilus oryzae TaxID=7048 RepID=A0A2S0BYZ4_SITOR|nr:glutathione-S-transferase epsilon class 5 [Sitophilus oryzae]
MAPKLYGIAVSPPVRSVLICAEALKLPLEFVTVNILAGDHLKEDFLKKNPLHTVPVLEDDDGTIIIDSHAILIYLVSKYKKNDPLYPLDNLKQKIRIDERLFFEGGTLSHRLGNVQSPLFKGVKPTESTLGLLKEGLGFLEAFLVNNKTKYIAGNNVTIADFSIVTTVTCIDNYVPYSQFPQLKAYIERLQKLPWYKVNEEGNAQLAGFIKSKLES